jgi:hypothetical protein
LQSEREVGKSLGSIEKQPDLGPWPSHQNLFPCVKIETSGAGLLPVREAAKCPIEQPLIAGLKRRG